MIKFVTKSDYSLKGSFTVPSDKSISHRAIMMASLINGKTLIKGVSAARDPLSTMEVCKNIGVKIEYLNRDDIVIHSSGEFQRYKTYLNCGNSGTTMRLMTGILASQKFNCILIGDESLSARPMKRIIEPLTQMGAVIYSTNNFPPFYINGHPLHGINYKSNLASAQVKSCILLAGLNAEGKTTFTEPTLSRNHTEIMLKYLNADISIDGLTVSVNPCSLEPKTIEVPGDISSAAFFIAAALIVPGSDIIIKNVGLNPTRTGIIDVVNQMGGDIQILDMREVCGEPVGDIRIRYSELKGINIEGEIIPRLIDELPIIAVMATQAKGQTVIKNAEDLRNKECDRIAAVSNILNSLGANVEETSDGFIINGKTPLKGDVTIDTFNDHRIAMSAFIAGLICKESISIKNFDCINISFPEFEQCFGKLISR